MYLGLDDDQLDFVKKTKPSTIRGQDREFIDANPVNIIPRRAWGAKPALYTTPLPDNMVKHVLYVYGTHTTVCHDQESCATELRDLQQRCFDKDKPDIFYNFMVGGDGNVYECRGWHNEPDIYMRLGDHMSPSTIYIGYIGDFVDINPSIKQWHAGWKLLEHGFRNNLISERDFMLYYCS